MCSAQADKRYRRRGYGTNSAMGIATHGLLQNLFALNRITSM
jgi:hypothetical protein